MGYSWKDLLSAAPFGALGLAGLVPQQNVNIPNEQQINSLLALTRQNATNQIGQQTAQANQGAAMKLASQGMSGSGIGLDVLNSNQANAIRALAQLEAAIGKEKMDALMQMAQLQLRQAALNQQANIANQQNMQGLGDTGLSLLTLAALG